MQRTITLFTVLVLASAALAGCVATDDDNTPTDPAPGEAPGDDGGPTRSTTNVTLTVLDAPAVSAAPGANTALTVRLDNPEPANVTARVAVTGGSGVTGRDPVTVTVPADGARVLRVDAAVDADATPGAHEVTVAASVGDAVAEGVGTLAVLSPGDGLARGGTVNASLVGRLTDGRVFLASDGNLTDLPYAFTDAFTGDAGVFTLTTGARANVPPAFEAALVGIRPGESRSVTLPPEDAFGPAHEDRAERRHDVFERVQDVPLDARTLPREQFRQMVNDSAAPQDTYAVNDTFTLSYGEDAFTFRVTEMTNDTVSYKLAAEVGDRYTLPAMPFWPKSAEVTAVHDAGITVRVTPTTAEGEAFTVHEHWPNASRVAELNETHVVVAHTPEEGLEYEVQQDAMSPPARAKVLAVDAESVHVRIENPHPLAGETIVFDVRALDVTAPAGA